MPEQGILFVFNIFGLEWPDVVQARLRLVPLKAAFCVNKFYALLRLVIILSKLKLIDLLASRIWIGVMILIKLLFDFCDEVLA